MHLTKQIKQGMHHAIMVHSKLYDKRDKKYTELKQQGDRLYKKAMGNKMKHINALPIQMFMTNTVFYLVCEKDIIKFETETRLPRMDYMGRIEEHALSDTDDVVVKYRKLNAEYQDIIDQIEKLKEQVTSILASVKTYKQLKDTWEEIIPIVAKFYQPKGQALIRADLTQVNKTLGL